MGRNESENHFLALLDLPNTGLTICSVTWSRLLKLLKMLTASHDISVFELDKNVSQLVLKRTGKHEIMNTSRISREKRCQKTLHSQKNDILMLIPAILSPTVFKILLQSSYIFKNKQKRTKPITVMNTYILKCITIFEIIIQLHLHFPLPFLLPNSPIHHSFLSFKFKPFCYLIVITCIFIKGQTYIPL